MSFKNFSTAQDASASGQPTVTPAATPKDAPAVVQPATPADNKPAETPAPKS